MKFNIVDSKAAYWQEIEIEDGPIVQGARLGKPFKVTSILIEWELGADGWAANVEEIDLHGHWVDTEEEVFDWPTINDNGTLAEGYAWLARLLQVNEPTGTLHQTVALKEWTP